ncbi:MAG: hypothetical protein AVO33_08165 [delta proteobacterium ML8_F1]|nr:MAG: hypothetical protein AVO33_08165 [delta proteobacterium ML8_F1]
MVGIVFALIAGVFVAIQSVFNARVSEHVGLWGTTVIVHGIGLVFSLAMILLAGEFTGLGEWSQINRLYLLGGAFGMVIVYSATRSVILVGPTLAIAVLIVTQLAVAMLVDANGWFGVDRLSLHWSKPLGILIMIIGIVIFKWRG